MSTIKLSETLFFTLEANDKTAEIEVFAVNERLAELQEVYKDAWLPEFVSYMDIEHKMALSLQQASELSGLVVDVFTSFVETAKKKRAKQVESLIGTE